MIPKGGLDSFLALLKRYEIIKKGSTRKHAESLAQGFKIKGTMYFYRSYWFVCKWGTLSSNELSYFSVSKQPFWIILGYSHFISLYDKPIIHYMLLDLVSSVDAHSLPQEKPTSHGTITSFESGAKYWPTKQRVGQPKLLVQCDALNTHLIYVCLYT